MSKTATKPHPNSNPTLNPNPYRNPNPPLYALSTGVSMDPREYALFCHAK